MRDLLKIDSIGLFPYKITNYYYETSNTETSSDREGVGLQTTIIHQRGKVALFVESITDEDVAKALCTYDGKEIYFCETRIPESVAKILSMWDGDSLIFNNNDLSVKSCHYLSKFKGHTLSVQGNYIGDEGVSILARGSYINLSVECTGMGEEGAEALETHFKGKRLEMTRNNIDDSVAKWISRGVRKRYHLSDPSSSKIPWKQRSILLYGQLTL